MSCSGNSKLIMLVPGYQFPFPEFNQIKDSLIFIVELSFILIAKALFCQMYADAENNIF